MRKRNDRGADEVAKRHQARELAWNGEGEAALRVASLIQTKHFRLLALAELLWPLLRKQPEVAAEVRAAALQLAGELDETGDRCRALARILQAQIRAGKLEGALPLARAIRHPAMKKAMGRRLLRQYAHLGLWEQAGELLEELKPTGGTQELSLIRLRIAHARTAETVKTLARAEGNWQGWLQAAKRLRYLNATGEAAAALLEAERILDTETGEGWSQGIKRETIVRQWILLARWDDALTAGLAVGEARGKSLLTDLAEAIAGREKWDLLRIVLTELHARYPARRSDWQSDWRRERLAYLLEEAGQGELAKLALGEVEEGWWKWLRRKFTETERRKWLADREAARKQNERLLRKLTRTTDHCEAGKIIARWNREVGLSRLLTGEQKEAICQTLLHLARTWPQTQQPLPEPFSLRWLPHSCQEQLCQIAATRARRQATPAERSLALLKVAYGFHYLELYRDAAECLAEAQANARAMPPLPEREQRLTALAILELRWNRGSGSSR